MLLVNQEIPQHRSPFTLKTSRDTCWQLYQDHPVVSNGLPDLWTPRQEMVQDQIKRPLARGAHLLVSSQVKLRDRGVGLGRGRRRKRLVGPIPYCRAWPGRFHGMQHIGN